VAPLALPSGQPLAQTPLGPLGASEAELGAFTRCPCLPLDALRECSRSTQGNGYPRCHVLAAFVMRTPQQALGSHTSWQHSRDMFLASQFLYVNDRSMQCGCSVCFVVYTYRSSAFHKHSSYLTCLVLEWVKT